MGRLFLVMIMKTSSKEEEIDDGDILEKTYHVCVYKMDDFHLIN